MLIEAGCLEVVKLLELQRQPVHPRAKVYLPPLRMYFLKGEVLFSLLFTRKSIFQPKNLRSLKTKC